MFRSPTNNEIEKYSITDQNAKIDTVWSEGVMLDVVISDIGVDAYLYVEDLFVPDHYRIEKNENNKYYLNLIARGTVYDANISLLENGYQIINFGHK